MYTKNIFVKINMYINILLRTFMNYMIINFSFSGAFDQEMISMTGYKIKMK